MKKKPKKKVKKAATRRPDLKGLNNIPPKEGTPLHAKITGIDMWSGQKFATGSKPYFETPQKLWEAALEYFQWCKDNPWHKRELIKGGDFAGMIHEVPIERPFTLSGLCVRLGLSRKWWNNFKSEQGKKVPPSEYIPILEAIEEIIYTQKFEGAAVGTFSATIIARDLGLVDKSEMDLGLKREQVAEAFPFVDDAEVLEEKKKKTKPKQ